MLPKLLKEIRKIEGGGRIPIRLTKKDKVFLVGDSKVRYIEDQLQDADGDVKRIECRSRKGKGTTSDFFKKKLFKKIPKYQKPIVLFWFGTCELTNKPKHSKYVYLKSNLPLELENLKRRYTRLKERILRINKDATVVFIDIPYCSILHFNATRAHPDLKQFNGKDKKLNDKIDELNAFLKTLNLPQHSPRLSQDTIQCTKKRGKPTKQNRNFSAYTDGVHPDITLARLWTLRILRLISIIRETQDESESSD